MGLTGKLVLDGKNANRQKSYVNVNEAFGMAKNIVFDCKKHIDYYSSRLEVFTSVPPDLVVERAFSPPGLSVLMMFFRVNKLSKAGKKVSAAIMHVANPADITSPRLFIPRC